MLIRGAFHLIFVVVYLALLFRKYQRDAHIQLYQNTLTMAYQLHLPLKWIKGDL